MLIRIPVYHATEESEALDKQEIDYDIDKLCDIRERTFAQIDNFGTRYDGLLEIESGASVFLSPCSQEDLEELLLEQEDYDQQLKIITYSPQAN